MNEGVCMRDSVDVKEACLARAGRKQVELKNEVLQARLRASQLAFQQ
jgi:hypothetical protein